MPFPSLIMGLIAKTKLKFPSGLTVVPRDYPIGAHIIIRSTAHIKGPRQVCIRYHKVMLQKRVKIRRRRLIDSLLPQSHQLSHHPQHQHEDQIDSTIFLTEQCRCTPCQIPICGTQQTSLLMSRVKSQLYHLRSMTYLSAMVQTPCKTSSSPLAIPIKKEEKYFEGELAQC